MTDEYDKLKNWLTDSGLFVSDVTDKNSGGVHSFYDEEKSEYGFLYPEITGYFISTLRFLESQNHQKQYLDFAKLSSDWIISIHKKYGSIIQGISSNPSNLSYSFDSAICAKGLLDYYEMSQDKQYLDYAKLILSELKNEAISDDGSVKPFKDISTNEYLESDQVWYKQEGCLHIKTAIPYFHLFSLTNDQDQLEIATKICSKVTTYQNSDGSIRLHKNSPIINLHTLCYALEGLIYGLYTSSNKEFHISISNAVAWCLSNINSDGSISLWFNSKYHSKAAYPISQLIRILILMDKFNKNTENQKKSLMLYQFLKTLHASNPNPKVNGGFYEEFYKSIFTWKKRLRVNSWTSMFALQALYWKNNYDELSFEDCVKYLY